MIHFCIFGAYEGELSADKKVYVTVCGGCELRRPTIARQLIEMRKRGRSDQPPPMHFFLTIFGATELKAPALVDEYLDFQDAVRAGMLTIEEWDRAIGMLASREALRTSSLTLCAGLNTNELPSEDEELDRLALNQHLGQIPEAAGRALMLAVGQSGSQRPAAVRQALAAAQLATA